ncbi:hypothetical protein C2E21_2809 [Chlorella sorokiniana]|uniref:Uncharacterized protein n=1 Tax=Chlorella sorokiniana TaxID=3076 RepID=A0A2P6TW56_CHLSO|nr:hypothetical protein C2E21_2809 [Chlorella sorokiniana]|eukprot:PRW58292.1 hypothetical protein C2E21_2809 [Chlorella sorokiniana]
MTVDQFNLFALPKPALALVLGALGHDDRERLQLVSRGWAKQFASEPLLSTQLAVRVSKLEACPGWQRKLTARGRHTEELTLYTSSKAARQHGGANGRDYDDEEEDDYDSYGEDYDSEGDEVPADPKQVALHRKLLACFKGGRLRRLTIIGCLAHSALSSQLATFSGLQHVELRHTSAEEGCCGLGDGCLAGELMDRVEAEELLPAGLQSFSLRLSQLPHPALLLGDLESCSALTALELGGVSTMEYEDSLDDLAGLTSLRRLVLRAEILACDPYGFDSSATCGELYLGATPVGGSGEFPLAALTRLTCLVLTGSTSAHPGLGRPLNPHIGAGQPGQARIGIGEGLSQLPQLQELHLDGLVDAVPADLWQCTGLSRLVIRAAPTDDPGYDDEAPLPELPPLDGARLPHLRVLCLRGCAQPDIVRDLVAAAQHLTALALGDLAFCGGDGSTDFAAELRQLAKLTALQELDLSTLELRQEEWDQLLPALAPLTGLRVLRLADCELHSLPKKGPYAHLEGTYEDPAPLTLTPAVRELATRTSGARLEKLTITSTRYFGRAGRYAELEPRQQAARAIFDELSELSDAGQLALRETEELNAMSESSMEEREAAAAPGQRRRMPMSEDEGEGEESEDMEAKPPPGKRARTRADAAEEEDGTEEQPCNVLLLLLSTCPPLVDALVEPDALRPVTLVARDAAHLAAALGARTADMAPLWCQLAKRLDPKGDSEKLPALPQALSMVQCAVRADPTRNQQMRAADAEKRYCVTRSDLHSLLGRSISASSFRTLDVLAIAHRKWGTMERVEQERAAAAAERRRAKAVQKQQSSQQKRAAAAAAAAAVSAAPHQDDGVSPWRLEYQKAEAERQARRKELTSRLLQECMYSELESLTAKRYINGTGRKTVDAVVAALKKAKRKAGSKLRTRAERCARITDLFTTNGLEGYLPSFQGPVGYSDVQGLAAYIEKGEGSAEAVLSAAKWRQNEERARDAREARITELLAAEGLEEFADHCFCEQYVELNMGCEESTLEMVRLEAAMKQAQAARRARVKELVAAEGLAEQRHMFSDYIQYERGALEEILAAAREQKQLYARAPEREAAVKAALEAEGIAWSDTAREYTFSYVNWGRGTQAEAVEAARNAEQRAQRREQLAALMAADGFKLRKWVLRLPSLSDYLAGEGSTTAQDIVAQVRVMHHQLQTAAATKTAAR